MDPSPKPPRPFTRSEIYGIALGAAVLLLLIAAWAITPTPNTVHTSDGPRELKFLTITQVSSQVREELADVGIQVPGPLGTEQDFLWAMDEICTYPGDRGDLVAIARRTVPSFDWRQANVFVHSVYRNVCPGGAPR